MLPKGLWWSLKTIRSTRRRPSLDLRSHLAAKTWKGSKHNFRVLHLGIKDSMLSIQATTLHCLTWNRDKMSGWAPRATRPRWILRSHIFFEIVLLSILQLTGQSRARPLLPFWLASKTSSSLPRTKSYPFLRRKTLQTTPISWLRAGEAAISGPLKPTNTLKTKSLIWNHQMNQATLAYRPGPTRRWWSRIGKHRWRFCKR